MKIALLGNPNTGKSSVFNMLTGLRQHVGNFPGITVDKKFSNLKIKGKSHQLIDFPGTISIYPKSFDEQVVHDVLLDPNNPDYPDLVLMVLDASNIRKGLLFCSQVYDLKIPMVLILNMNDVAKKKGISVDVSLLEKQMPGIKVVHSIARIGLGTDDTFFYEPAYPITLQKDSNDCLAVLNEGNTGNSINVYVSGDMEV